MCGKYDLTTSSGVIRVGGFNAGFSSAACSSGNLPLPKTSPFFGSCSTGTASNFYIYSTKNAMDSIGCLF